MDIVKLYEEQEKTRFASFSKAQINKQLYDGVFLKRLKNGMFIFFCTKYIKKQTVDK